MRPVPELVEGSKGEDETGIRMTKDQPSAVVFAKTLTDHFGRKARILKRRESGILRKLTDPSKIHALGWHHKIEIDEGIEKLYRWYLINLLLNLQK